MNSILFHRIIESRSTILSISAQPASFTIRIQGHLNPKQRRALARRIFIQLKPLISFLKFVSVDHLDYGAIDFFRSEERGLNPFKQADLQSKNAQFGLNLRLYRQQKGLNLRDFGELVGITASHLSEIERGLHFPHPKTLYKIIRVSKIC
jgi:hypothetical protein